MATTASIGAMAQVGDDDVGNNNNNGVDSNKAVNQQRVDRQVDCQRTSRPLMTMASINKRWPASNGTKAIDVDGINRRPASVNDEVGINALWH